MMYFMEFKVSSILIGGIKLIGPRSRQSFTRKTETPQDS